MYCLIRCVQAVFVCLSVLFPSLATAQNVPKSLPDQLSEQIVIHYERTNGVLARGQEIRSDHRKLADLIATHGQITVEAHGPVFSAVVSQMISNNWTEVQWQTQKARPRKQIGRVPSNSSGLSTTVSIRLKGDAREVERILKQLNEDSQLFHDDGFRIIAAEPVKLLYMSLTPNDPMYTSQWSHQVTGAAQAWDTETGDPSVVIAVIDSGVDPNHEDLQANLQSGRDFVHIDTERYQAYGYTLIPQEDYTNVDNDPSDYNGHGTHVAGIAGASGNNGKGVAGVCHSCSIMPLRAGFSILYDGAEYGTLEDGAVANAIVYAADNGADIINMSFGGQGSLVLSNALEYAHSLGVMLVAAAGNSGSSGVLYPAGYDHVVGVASSDVNDKLSWYSNYGVAVDLVAPGESILSTVPATGGSLAHPTGYRILDGTSMASPYVAGLAGLIKSKNPAWTDEEILAAIISTAQNIDASNPDRKSQIGYGRVNVASAVDDSPAPNVVFDNYTITELTGNHNGHINPGEQISLVVNLKNLWSTANSVTVSLTSLDPYVSISQGIANYQSIAMGASKTNAATPFLFTTTASTPDNHVIEFNLAIEYDGVTRHEKLNLESSLTDKFLVPANYPTIQAAINAASNGDEIVVSPGTYYENINFLGKNIAVVSLYQSTGDRKYIESTIIDGSKPTDIQKASTVTIRSGEDASTLLSGFTILGGSGTYTMLPENPYPNYFGGGILCLESSPVLKNLIIRNNTLSSSNGGGGGIMISHGRPVLEDLDIRENEMSAGLYITKVNNPSSVMAKNIRVARSIDRDGIYISTSDVRLKDISVEGCIGDVSTGLFMIYSTVEVDGAAIHGNNKGVDVRACNRITIRNTAITNNSGDGGIWCTTTDLELINTTLAGNHLTNHYGGAGVFITNTGSKLTLVNSILHGNWWTEYNTGIVRSNQISFLDDGGALTAAYSNIEGGQAGVKYFDGSSQITVSWLQGNINGDPLFFKPEKNDYQLSTGSPSIETGSANFQHNGRIYVDLKPGEFNGGAPNMGAYVFSPPYVRAQFSANTTDGNAPLNVQFINDSYGFKTLQPDTWAWDFGDGTTSTSSGPVHQYNAAGEYTVKLKVMNNGYADEEIRLAYIRVFDSDTLYVSTSGSDATGTGSKEKPYKTIQYGIDQSSDNDVVVVADGIYPERLNFGGRDVRVSSYYQINRNESHIQATIIDGSSNGQVAIFSKGESKNAGLYGLTIQHGYANGSNWPTYEGGGLYIVDSSPTLMDLIVKDNKSNYRGGGIYIKNGSPRMERVTVLSNHTVGLYAAGGGMYIEQSQSVMKDCIIMSNSTQYDGGGVLLGYNAKPDIENVAILNNTAGRYGGGLHIESNNLQLKKMTVMNNSASQGGGICSSFSNSVISFTILAGNTGSTEGGGIYYLGNAANPKLENVTLYNNASPVGREIRTNSAKVVVSNSILWNTSGMPISGTAFITYSDVSGGFSGTGNISSDPKLLDPSNGDYSLDKTSPCIDKGDPSMTDPNGTIIDMGALWYDRPIIIGVVSPIVIAEDDERPLYPTDLLVVNTPNDYPGAYSVVPKPGAHYTISGSTIKPEPNFYGSIVVPVILSNNSTTSEEFDLPVAISSVNDAPVIIGQKSLAVLEDNPLQVILSDLTVTDVDHSSSDFNLMLLPGSNYSVLTTNVISPSTNFNGTLTVTAIVSDGETDSAPFNLNVSVIPVNDAPVISTQNPLSISEDSEITLSLNDFVVNDVDHAAVSLALKVYAGQNYTVYGNTVIPVANFNGTLTVPIIVGDGTSDSTPFNTSITVTPVNDPPVIIAQQPLQTDEDTEFELQLESLTVEDVDNKESDFVLTILEGTNYHNSNGFILPATDFNGTLSVAVVVRDGDTDSEPFDVRVTVLPVNDAPVITGADEFNIDGQNTLPLSIGDVEVTDVDNEFSELIFEVVAGPDYTIAENTIQAVPNFGGQLRVGVRVGDGSAYSEVYPVIVNVTLVTDAEGSTDNNIRLYPNPTRAYIYLTNITETGKADIQMFSAEGKAVNIAPYLDGNLLVFAVSHLAEGTYFVRIQTKNGTMWRKVILDGRN